MRRVVLGMSGGVDSAVSALLLKRQGYDVIGVFMNNWEEKDEDGVCTSQDDWEDARSCCDALGIPCYSVNFSREYMDRVFSRFLDEYRAGRTPNPDVLCNREIKFKAFLEYALKIGAERIATGHYVRTDGHGRLLRGADAHKDQSYFLHMLKRQQLLLSLFPVGNLSKPEVRMIAAQAGLPVSGKKDSTGVCFIGERHFKRFLQEYLPAQPGDIVTPEGVRVGEHDGLMFYTIGQRRGLRIGGQGDGRRWFVADKNLRDNQLIVVQGEDHPLLYVSDVSLDSLTWVGDPPGPQGTGIPVTAKLRYRQPDQDACLTWQTDVAVLRFSKPQRAVTPGQSAALYQGEVCLGGGIIRGGKGSTA